MSAGSSIAAKITGVGPSLDGRLTDVPHLREFTSRKGPLDRHSSIKTVTETRPTGSDLSCLGMDPIIGSALREVNRESEWFFALFCVLFRLQVKGFKNPSDRFGKLFARNRNLERLT